MTFTHDDFIKRLKELYAENVAISKAKNSDYGTYLEPLKSVLACEVYDVSAVDGLISRISEKLMRITLAVHSNQPLKVKTETSKDTCSDGANYFMILRILLEWQEALSTEKLNQT